MLLSSVATLSRSPDRLPGHWNLAGEVDRWDDKVQALFTTPLLAAALFGFLTFIPRLDARRNNVRFSLVTHRLRRGTMLVLAGIHAAVLAPAYGLPVNINVPVSLALGLLFILIATTLHDLPQGQYIGVRTPWTLASQDVWRRTHRVASALFMVAGVVSIGGAIVVPSMALVVTLATLGGASLVSVIPSFVAWRGRAD